MIEEAFALKMETVEEGMLAEVEYRVESNYDV
jgi:hypothetical protein